MNDMAINILFLKWKDLKFDTASTLDCPNVQIHVKAHLNM